MIVIVYAQVDSNEMHELQANDWTKREIEILNSLLNGTNMNDILRDFIFLNKKNSSFIWTFQMDLFMDSIKFSIL